MSGVVTTTETYPVPPATAASMQGEQQLRLQAGAVTCNIDSSDPTQFVLTTQWNVLGQNGPTLKPTT